MHYAFTEELARQRRAEVAAAVASGSRRRAHNRPVWERWVVFRSGHARRLRTA